MIMVSTIKSDSPTCVISLVEQLCRIHPVNMTHLLEEAASLSMYKIIPDKNNYVRVHNTQDGELLLSFVNESGLSPSKQFIAYAFSPKKLDDCFIKIKRKSLSEFVNDATDQNHFYSCEKCDQPFPSFSELKQHQFCCTESIEADESPKDAEYPWSSSYDPTYDYPKSATTTTYQCREEKPIDDVKLVANDQHLFLQSFNLVKKDEKFTNRKKTDRGLNLQCATDSPYCTPKPLCSNENKEYCIDFSSPLGISSADHPSISNFVAFTRQIGNPFWYETFCGSRAMCKQTLPYLRDRNAINAPKAPVSKKLSQSTHMYSFTKQQRTARFRFLLTGLTKEGRRLKRLCRNFDIVLSRLSRETLKKWGAFGRRSRKSNPRPKLSLAQVKQTLFLDNQSIKEDSKVSPPVSKSLFERKNQNISNQSNIVDGKKPNHGLYNSFVSIEDLSSLLVKRADGRICVRGSNYFIRSSTLQQNMLHRWKKSNPKCSKTGLRYCRPKHNKHLLKHSATMPQLHASHTSKHFCLLDKKPEPEVIDITSDDDDVVEECYYKSNAVTTHCTPTNNVKPSNTGKNSCSENSPDFVDIENSDSDDEIIVSERLRESLQIYSHCSVKLSDVTSCSSSKDTVEENSVNQRLQPITHLFKCHACQDVEQLYHNQASQHIQRHMSEVHDIGLSGMFDHLIEHQQDFGTYFVIVVEAFPDLSLSPSKYSKSYSGIDFKKYVSDRYL